jgi:bifunctional non-homologous end joining protein LigD
MADMAGRPKLIPVSPGSFQHRAMSLETYRRKRDFRHTPEPSGRVARRGAKRLSFVIQKHAASRLHYDFRLELDGVLLSWAVPKGPSLDPRDKRLAVHVEDHPLDYADFEGTIPPKQYGAGTVIVWDRGEWLPKEDPREGYRRGKLKFELKGEKLRGGWMLFKSGGGRYDDGKSWLLIKERDDAARDGAAADIVARKPKSVISDRSLEDLAQAADAPGIADTPGVRRAPMPAQMEAQLATLVDAAPAGTGWLHEIKYDGYRMLCRIERGRCELWSRNGRDWTRAFPTIATAAAKLQVKSAWIDGEVVMPVEGGGTSFQALQNALSGDGEAALLYYAFDLLYCDGYDLRGAALADRKRVLEPLLEGSARIRYSQHFETDGPSMLAQTCRLGLEGIVSKRADSPYVATRGRTWLKVKCGKRQEFVIGGFTPGQGSRSGFGALLVGVYDGGALRYAGKVGTGFDNAALNEIRAMLDKLRTDKPSFANPPRGAEGRRAIWVKPKLVGEIAFTEWTRDGTLRHPSFQGLRLDKAAKEVVREQEKRIASRRGRR